MRKKDSITYKNCTISYTVSSDDIQFSAFAHILCITNTVGFKEIIRDRLYSTSDEAEKAIIEKAKDWIDSNA